MGYGYDLPRKNVTLDGIPIKWHTNLSDDQLTQLYWKIKEDLDIRKPDDLMSPSTSFSIGINIFDELIEFEDGACHCIGINGTVYAIYKTIDEWDLWTAHRKEINELREEQELEREVENELLRTEENHLIESFTAAIDEHDYDSAFSTFCARADLLKKKSPNGLAFFFTQEIFMNLSRLPLKHSVKFLKKYDLPWTAYPRLAGSMAFWIKPTDGELLKVFEAGIAQFPLEGRLYKETALFWRRRKNFKLAIEICEIAIKKGIADDTKSGFLGRLSRLKKEAEQVSSYNSGQSLRD